MRLSSNRSWLSILLKILSYCGCIILLKFLSQNTAQRNLPSYEEVIQMSGNFTDAPLNRTRRKGTVNINMQQLE